MRGRLICVAGRLRVGCAVDGHIIGFGYRWRIAACIRLSILDGVQPDHAKKDRRQSGDDFGLGTDLFIPGNT